MVADCGHVRCHEVTKLLLSPPGKRLIGCRGSGYSHREFDPLMGYLMFS